MVRDNSACTCPNCKNGIDVFACNRPPEGRRVYDIGEFAAAGDKFAINCANRESGKDTVHNFIPLYPSLMYICGGFEMSSNRIGHNVTSFPLHALDWFRKLPEPGKYDFLKYYQYMTMKFVTEVDNGAKGCLIYHDPGLGKTLLAIAISMELILTGLRVIMLLTKSLVDNMRDSIKLYIRLRRESDREWPIGLIAEADWDAYIDANFSFVSMNASNMIGQMQKAAATDLDGIDAALEEKLENISAMSTLNDHVLIVDEAHNLFRAITNGSKNAMGVYELVMKSPRCRFFPLSGTPIANDPFEMVPCFAMLSGDPKILPDNYSEFRKIFIQDTAGRATLKNAHILQNRIMGLVSRVSTTSRPGATSRESGPTDTISTSNDMPELYPAEIVRVRMDGDQFAAYMVAREAELSESAGRGGGGVWLGRLGDRGPPKSSPMNKPKSGMVSSYRSKSRRASNYVRGAPRSPKFEAILQNLTAHPGEHAICYSQFVTDGGLRQFGDYLIANGWSEVKVKRKITGSAAPPDPPLDVDSPPSGPKFAIYSGEISTDERLILKEMYNSPQNADASQLALLLLSATGAEGLDLKRGRHAHVMEPYWNYKRILQIIARIVRNGSHSDMPPEKRNVHAYVYLAIPPLGSESASPTTDEEMWTDALADEALVNSFVDIYDTVSIECLANGGKECVVCNPNGRPLYSDDIYRDMREPNPCSGVVEKRITATEIEIDGVKYYYAPKPESPFGFAVWRWDEKIRAHMPLKQDEAVFMDIITAAREERR